jgi:hypothetical protein
MDYGRERERLISEIKMLNKLQVLFLGVIVLGLVLMIVGRIFHI